MVTRRGWLIYGMLIAIWAMLIGWQWVEHDRVRVEARQTLINRAKISLNTLGLLMRSQRFFGVISTERLESALHELVNAGDLHAVVLLNESGDQIASAGEPIDPPLKDELRSGVHWEDQKVTMVNPVDLGTNMDFTLVMPRGELSSLQTNRPPAIPVTNADGTISITNGPSRRRFGRRGRTNEFASFSRPSWMKEEEYKALIQKKGVHWFVIGMSTQSVQEAYDNDLWVRMFIGLLGTICVAGYGLAWHSLVKTSELQLRLVRASELNLHLKEMNLAAAGLAHETRNPLNIIRGLAQLICKQQDASPEVRAKTRDIIDETDRVTAQLNEFINYSRPREVRRAPVDLSAVTAEVARTLTYDIEEKSIQLQVLVEQMMIEADEQLLRQALFNLAINAVQAVGPKGEIRIRASRRNNEEAFIEISDNGPGVAPENRTELFKPYFTTNEEGTGLGLSVVQQIVLAHGWEIECVPNEPRGAVFRIAHIKICGKS